MGQSSRRAVVFLAAFFVAALSSVQALGYFTYDPNTQILVTIKRRDMEKFKKWVEDMGINYPGGTVDPDGKTVTLIIPINLKDQLAARIPESRAHHEGTTMADGKRMWDPYPDQGTAVALMGSEVQLSPPSNEPPADTADEVRFRHSVREALLKGSKTDVMPGSPDSYQRIVEEEEERFREIQARIHAGENEEPPPYYSKGPTTDAFRKALDEASPRKFVQGVLMFRDGFNEETKKIVEEAGLKIIDSTRSNALVKGTRKAYERVFQKLPLAVRAEVIHTYHPACGVGKLAAGGFSPGVVRLQ